MEFVPLRFFSKPSAGVPAPGALGQRVLDDLVLAARGLHGAAQLGVVFDGDALKGRKNHGRNLRKLGFQFVQILLLFACAFS